MKTLPRCESMENTLNVNRKLPKGKRALIKVCTRAKQSLSLKPLQGALNYFNGKPMHCTTTLNYLGNACRTEMIFQAAMISI